MVYIKKILVLLILSLLSSCINDNSEYEDKEVDGDNINLIDKIGIQSSDKAKKIYIDSMSTAS